MFLNLPTNLPNISVSDSHPLESLWWWLIFNVDGIGGLVGYNILNDIDYNDAFTILITLFIIIGLGNYTGLKLLNLKFP